ncbi:MAG: cobalamin B12-binding domain-containing protein [Sulfolobales archaeon]
MQRRIKVLIAKVGLDGHDRGAKVVARGLRDLGMEVIYTGLRQTPEQIVRAAIQEDVDVIGISILSGVHLELIPKIIELVKKNNLNDIGGVIPPEDIPKLKEIGVDEVFLPGSSIKEIAEKITNIVKKKRGINV